ncbi:MAG TPA: hypothetical protein DEA08_15600 [Planctomycetes bacterium]|nr:hypothetical protein [Planctomycetota bacterium]
MPRGRCPYCHDDIQAEEQKHGCSSCMAWHHQACWDEAHATCSACGETQAARTKREAPTCSMPDCERAPARLGFCRGHGLSQAGRVLTVLGGLGFAYIALGVLVSLAAMSETSHPVWSELIGAVTATILIGGAALWQGRRLRRGGAALLAAPEEGEPAPVEDARRAPREEPGKSSA